MSRVYFHSPSGEVELLGGEQAHLRGLVYDLALGVLKVNDHDTAKRLRALLPAGKLGAEEAGSPRWTAYYETAFRVAGDDDRTPLIQWRGRPLSTFSLALNTAAVLGNDAVKLAARIVGQGEIHAWVDGPNRAWVAGIMQAGLDSGVYRNGLWFEPALGGERKWEGMGWGDVITFLRSRDDEPVVMSYSVAGSFPSPEAAGWDRNDEGDYDWGTWGDLNTAQHWHLGMEALRASGQGLEIKPDDWDDFRFTHTLSALDLRAQDWEERARRALGD
jgi:hypothetical protein